MVFLFSCKEEIPEYNSPKLELIQDSGYLYADSSLYAGDTVLVKIKASSQSDYALTQIHIERITENDTITIDTGIYNHTITFVKKIVKSNSDFETWTFTASDRNRVKSESITINISKKEFSTYNDIIHIPSVLFGFQNNNEIGSFYSLSSQEIFDTENAYNFQDNIHLVAYYDYSGDEHVIASPGANISEGTFAGSYDIVNWTTLNTTRFLLSDISTDEFDNCSNDSLIYETSFTFEVGKRKAKNLSQGDVYAFVSDKGYFGLIKVKSLTGTNEGNIEIEIKMK